jgi:glycosyltransferase involved in cell wall biosynthesis
VHEQGLSHARNAAVKLLSGDYVVWTDDDVLVDRGWLVGYERAFRQWPEAAIFGGPIQPCFEGRAPAWLMEVLEDVGDAFALRDFGARAIPLDGGAVTPFGANFAVRLREQRKFPYDLRLGKKLDGGLLGEEVGVLRAMIEAGHTGWWVPDASVEHVISKDRQTLAFLWSYYTTSGRTAQTLNPAEGRMLFGRPRWLWRKAVKAEIEFRIKRFGGNPRSWIEPFRKAAYYRGMLGLKRT